MFAGHYAVAFALKGKEKGASLGMLFIATQFVDILFFPFVLLGIEKLNFVKDFTAVNNFEMVFPYTHSLMGSILWAILFYILYRFIINNNKGDKKRIALIMAIGVLSHWFTDFIVHTRDLPLISGEPKYGFGMWNNKLLTFSSEALLLVLGLFYYLRKTTAIKKSGRYFAIVFVLFLLLVNYLSMYVLPADENLNTLTISALFSYFIFALMAHFVDKKRA